MKKRIKVWVGIIVLSMLFSIIPSYVEAAEISINSSNTVNKQFATLDSVFSKKDIGKGEIDALSKFANVEIVNRMENGISYKDYNITSKEPIEIREFNSNEKEEIYETTTYSYVNTEDIDNNETIDYNGYITLKVSMKYSYHYVGDVKVIKVHTVEGTVVNFNKTGLRYSGVTSWASGTRYAENSTISERGQESFSSPETKIPEVGKVYSYDTDFIYYYAENDSIIKADFYCQYNDGDQLYHVACTVQH